MSKIIKVVSYEVPYGFPESRRHMILGYVLADGTVEDLFAGSAP